MKRLKFLSTLIRAQGLDTHDADIEYVHLPVMVSTCYSV